MDINKDIYGTCFNPQKITYFNPIKCMYEEVEVPCGKCYHCLITKVNEWVTRMTAQSKYSKNTYYVTLTYDSALHGTKFFASTFPVVHSFNEFHRKMPAPLTLNKKHVQDFFKRLRKNTGSKFQYFACGEYGDNFSRPHYHVILWSDDDITHDQFQFAWSIVENGKRYNIGHVEYENLNETARNPLHPYKYVCKYLQKREFDFKTLKTYKYHYANYKRNFEGISIKTAQGFDDYQRLFSPFFLCSKRPAIGYSYFEENKDRFLRQDFRLFNLPEDSVFPSYYYRKTKEFICPYKTISTTTFKQNTYSAIPQVVTLLSNLQDCIKFNEDFSQTNPTYEYIGVTNYSGPADDPDTSRYFSDGRTPRQTLVSFISNSDLSNKRVVVPKKYFDFYDCKNKLYYSLASDFQYNIIDSKKNLIYTLPVNEVLKEVTLSYKRLYDEFLLPNMQMRDFNKQLKMQMIIDQYGDIETYHHDRKLGIQNLLNNVKQKQDLYKRSKTRF